MSSFLCGCTLLLLTAGGALSAAAKARVKVNATLASDGRAFTFAVPGTVELKGSFSATVVTGGQTQDLVSAAGRLALPVEELVEETPYGWASVMEATLRFEKEKLELLFRLGRVPGLSGMLAQAGIRNIGPAPLSLVALTPVVLEGRVLGSPSEWLVTALDDSIKTAAPVRALTDTPEPFRVHEFGGFYHKDGNGFLFGPVGAPNAYMDATIVHRGEGKIAFKFAADMSAVRVVSGETRWGQQAALLAEPPRTALIRWARWVAQTHKARTAKGALSGWSSWSFHGMKITGRDVLAQVETVFTSAKRLCPEVMEIDAGYEDDNGEETNEKFPEGMAFYAQKIAATGARPGLFLNFDGPPGWSTITGRIRKAVQNGFTYLKMNRTGLSFEPQEIPSKTSFEVMREGFTLLREAAGEGTYLLYNESRPDRATVGLVDANRTGMESSRLLVRDAMTDVLRSYPLNNRWFAVDNDSYYMGTDIANVSEIAGGWPLVRTWMSMVGLSCGAAITADPWHWESFRPYWRNVEVMTPPAREKTEVLDLCTSREWPRLVGCVKRDWGDMTVALLWNPGMAERTVTLDFAEVGMKPTHRYAVWSFWDNRYLGVARGSWTTPALGPSASQHLCFTDLDCTPLDTPVLIGSSLHIYCGAAEIKNIRQWHGEMEVELTDAGARSGDLFIYSRRQPVWKGASGCAVAEIASAGEYVWRISLADRQSGQPQRIVLGILLPVTRQRWFWMLCGLMVASLLFSVWKYVAWNRAQLAVARLEQQTARQQERVRIAADLHDELGAGLTRIFMLSEPTGSGNLAKIRHAALEMTRELDEIVWAVNPKNDRLDRLAMYLDAYAQEMLDVSGLESRVDFPVPLPHRPVPAPVRHSLFLAFKEALTNVVKHAGARRVQLCLTVKPEGFSLSVEDDGRGFQVPEAGLERDDSGNGLENMRERLAAVGGRCTISSVPGSGTRVIFELPLER